MSSGSLVTTSTTSRDAKATLADATYQRALDGGLLLRWSTADDVEGLARLCAEAFRDEEADPPNAYFGHWAEDLMSGRHPLTGPGDFALVEDTATGDIVACAVLMRQTWEYEGISFPVGRPEAVATNVAYRNRGLIRAIFELLHARCDARGDMAVGITGIYYYYRQFGYEYALDFGGSRRIAMTAIPALATDATEPYTLRAASLDDLPRVMALYERDRARALVSAVIDEPTWRWITTGMHPDTDENWLTQVILDGDQRIVGYVLTARARYGNMFTMRGLSIDEGVAMTAVLPSVLRALAAQAAVMRAPHPRTQPATMLSLGLGRAHPAYDALPPSTPILTLPPYAWYVRVADLPAFVRRIAPALERRLAGSIVEGYTGEVKLSFYRGGLRLVFAAGRLTT
ncbi:MAG TPA: GNAT family N-acetyltransferase, partial [Ktedonobacterales bacterium]|nr:GNAT family N-acetyltransferase [Ktedonobacterales bacterium]